MNTEDPDFGSCFKRITGAWLADVPWEQPCSGSSTARVYLPGSAEGPSESQRVMFRALKDKYPSVWPEVATKLVEIAEEADLVEQLPAALKPRLMISIPGTSQGIDSDFCLTYEFRKSPNPMTGYFLDFAEWEIVRAVKAS